MSPKTLENRKLKKLKHNHLSHRFHSMYIYPHTNLYTNPHSIVTETEMKHVKCPPTDACTHKFGLSIQCNIYCNIIVIKIQQWIQMNKNVTCYNLNETYKYYAIWKKSDKKARVHDFICKKLLDKPTETKSRLEITKS